MKTTYQYTIEKITKITSKKNFQYLESMGIDWLIAYNFIKEIHYTLDGSKFIGFGIENLDKGIEIINYGCIGKKSCTLIGRDRDPDEDNRLLIFNDTIELLLYLSNHSSLHCESYLISHSMPIEKITYLINLYDSHHFILPTITGKTLIRNNNSVSGNLL